MHPDLQCDAGESCTTCPADCGQCPALSPHRTIGSALESLRLICEVDPLRPSAAAPPERRRELTGDLDNIILKALHKEPARRYASVEQLADDLGRFLDGLPVAARTATVGYARANSCAATRPWLRRQSW